MSRSKWKGPFLNLKINAVKKSKFVEKQNEYNKEKIIANRSSEIVPSVLGLTFNVHNGKNYIEVNVTDNMIGHKFGEFSLTRAKFSFKKKKLKK
jgi:small subunit ribosomal protein S19